MASRIALPASGTGGLTKITEQILSGVAASVVVSNIPATYRHLVLTVVARSDYASSANVDLLVQYNGDTGANYDYSNSYGNSTFGGAVGAAMTSARLGGMTAAGAVGTNAAYPSGMTITVYDYARAQWIKTASAIGFGASGPGVAPYVLWAGANWRNTAAIASLTLFPASGNFVAGSAITLWGMS